jgi:light-regulated signal transduction histidine kinase (bacteriophytochrome)
VIFTFHDITERKRAEQALERSNRMLKEFAFAAAHDLQEPLRNVALSCELLARKYKEELDANAVRLIDTSVEGARRMNTMVTDLLDYTKLIDDDVSDVPTIDTAAALHHALANLGRKITETRAVVTHDALPAVAMRETHLVQLFQNLISNSLKYAKPDRPLQVEVMAQQQGGEWVFSVRDNGIGFDPAHASRIFGLFKRLHNRSDYPGTGIGLAICSRIVEHYGGRIWADAIPDVGATFFFTARQADIRRASVGL